MDELDEEIRILEAGLTAYRDEYKEQADIWKMLESKAQTVITVSGFFLAATFAFVKQSGLALITADFVTITLLCLLSGLLKALQVLQAEDFYMPVDGAFMVHRANVLSRPSHSNIVLGYRYKQFVRELCEEAADVLDGIDTVNGRKTLHLLWAYRFIVASAISGTIAAILPVVSGKDLGRNGPFLAHTP